jgi:transcriptional regulator of heat shock response
MQSRTQDILYAVISEFIRTGEPVSSGQLFKKYNFNVKPATIRNELSVLSDTNYLVQPHTSGGRVPTDKGYRFFVDQISNRVQEREKRLSKNLQSLSHIIAEQEYDDFIGNFARSFHALGVVYDSRGTLHKSGLRSFFDSLIQEQYMTDINVVQEIIRDFEEMDQRMQLLTDMLSHERQLLPSVFVGKSPITKSPHLSVIADQFDIDGDTFFLAMIGPKRMDYKENIQFFINLKDTICE